MVTINNTLSVARRKPPLSKIPKNRTDTREKEREVFVNRYDKTSTSTTPWYNGNWSHTSSSIEVRHASVNKSYQLLQNSRNGKTYNKIVILLLYVTVEHKKKRGEESFCGLKFSRFL